MVNKRSQFLLMVVVLMLGIAGQLGAQDVTRGNQFEDSSGKPLMAIDQSQFQGDEQPDTKLLKALKKGQRSGQPQIQSRFPWELILVPVFAFLLANRLLTGLVIFLDMRSSEVDMSVLWLLLAFSGGALAAIAYSLFRLHKIREATLKIDTENKA